MATTTATKTTRTAGASTAANRRKAAATRRSTAAKRAAATRTTNRAATARKRSTAARKAAATRAEAAKTPVVRVQEYAERAVLIPVGAALVVRDTAIAAVNDLVESVSTRDRAERQLKRFERRGATARNRVERQVRKTRTRAERTLRQRRTRVERELRQRRTRLERGLRNSNATAKNVQSQVELVSTQVENAVQTGITAGTEFASRVQERVARVS
jgi:hypothetical protein